MRVAASTKEAGRSAAWSVLEARSAAALVARIERRETGGRPPRQLRLLPRISLRSMRATVHASPADAGDVGAAGDELVLEALEAAVEMIDAVDHGLAFGGGRPLDA